MSKAPDSESVPGFSRIIRRHVASPYGFDILIQVDGQIGLLESVGDRTEHLSHTTQLIIQRSVLYVTASVMAVEKNGGMASDVKDDMPDIPQFNIEHALLHEIIAVQTIMGASARMLTKTLKQGRAL